MLNVSKKIDRAARSGMTEIRRNKRFGGLASVVVQTAFEEIAMQNGIRRHQAPPNRTSGYASFVPGAGIQSNEIWTVGHLKPGVSPETAAADPQVIATPFQKDDPIYFPPQFKIVVNTLNSQSVGRDFKVGLVALMAAVTVLLLIACSNIANLLLARATTREGVFGIHSALGASRLRPDSPTTC